MILKLDAKRRLTLPVDLTDVKAGDVFDATFDAEENAVVFRKISKGQDWLSVLKECPASMDDLPPRSGEMFRSKL